MDVVTLEQTALIRVACVDDDTLIREGALRLISGLDVVAAYRSVSDFLEDGPDVDVVLLDLWLRDPQSELAGVSPFGSAAVAAVSSRGYRVLIYTNEHRRLVLARCLAAGARGIVHKSEPLAAVPVAVEAVARGEVVITAALTGLAEVVQRHGEMPTLSPRQLEVLRARARGESFRSIASRLYISPRTVEEYMGEVTKRFSEYLRTHSAADLERMLGVGDDDLLGGA